MVFKNIYHIYRKVVFVRYVSILFDSPASSSLTNCSHKCHFLDTDVDKFLIAKKTTAGQTEFFSKSRSFTPEAELNQSLFDNRFTLYANSHEAHADFCEFARHMIPGEQMLVYQVCNSSHDQDQIHLKVISMNM